MVMVMVMVVVMVVVVVMVMVVVILIILGHGLRRRGAHTRDAGRGVLVGVRACWGWGQGGRR